MILFASYTFENVFLLFNLYFSSVLRTKAGISSPYLLKAVLNKILSTLVLYSLLTSFVDAGRKKKKLDNSDLLLLRTLLAQMPSA